MKKELNINDINSGDRYRKDLGDIEKLAESIREIGLLHPIVIDEGYNLIVGERRLEALKQLDIVELEEDKHFRIVDIEDVLRAEYDENAVRKDFLPSENVAIWEAIERLPGGRGKTRSESEQVSLDKPIKQASSYLGVSTDTLSKAKQVVDSGDTELIQKMDKTGSVNSAYRKLKLQDDIKRIETEAPTLKERSMYRTIVIDPPWELPVAVSDSYHGRIHGKYSMMSNEQIKQWFIDNISEHIEEDAHIYLWITNSNLEYGFELLRSWGFEYKTVITWVKPQIGLGAYYRNNTEHILFGVKGRLGLKRKDVGTWFQAERKKHSEKPDKAYELIESCSHPPYLDIFARKKRDGWDILGDENGD